MRKKIAWGPDDIKGLFIKEEGESIPYTSEIRERINGHLIDAYGDGHNLILICKHKKHSRMTYVNVSKDDACFSFWNRSATNDEADDNILTKCFETAISDFKKKWGEKLKEEKLEQGMKYCFMF